MSWSVPTIAEFKAKFVRDFNYAAADDQANLTKVLDADIQSAYDNAYMNFNPIYGTDAQSTNAFMYLAAYYLVLNIQNSTQGLSSQSNFPVNSKSVGGVSLNFAIPEKYLKSPILNQFTQNGYGMMYLNMSLPFMVGNAHVIDGTTTWT